MEEIEDEVNMEENMDEIEDEEELVIIPKPVNQIPAIPKSAMLQQSSMLKNNTSNAPLDNKIKERENEAAATTSNSNIFNPPKSVKVNPKIEAPIVEKSINKSIIPSKPVQEMPAKQRRGVKKEMIPSWYKDIFDEKQQTETTDWIEFIKNEVPTISVNLTVSIKSVICSSPIKSQNGSSAVIKLCVVPVPNKIVSLRAVETVHDNNGQNEFSFDGKVAIVGMSMGDIRSKLFKQGACSRLQFEFTVGNTSTDSTSYSSSGAIYLPSLLKYHANETLALNMIGTNDILSTILFEVKCDQYAAAQDKSSSIPTLPRVDYGSVRLRLDVLGFVGNELKSYRNDLILTTSLLSSGLKKQDVVKNSKQVNSKIIDIDPFSRIQVESKWPRADILEIIVSKGPFQEDELGRVQLPVCLLLDSNSTSSKLNDGLYRHYPLKTEYSISEDLAPKPVQCSWQIVMKCQSTHHIDVQHNINTEDLAIQTDETDNLNPNNTIEGTDEDKAMMSSVPVDIKASSSFGTLLTCVQGILIKSKQNVLASFSPLSCTVAMILNPIGEVRKTSSALAGKLKDESTQSTIEMAKSSLRGSMNETNTFSLNSDEQSSFEYGVEWNQVITNQLSWSNQQRDASFLEFQLIAESGGQSSNKAAIKRFSNSIVSTFKFDAASLDYHANQLIQTMIPFYKSTSDNAITCLDSDQSAQNVTGWMLLGIQFTPSDKRKIDITVVNGLSKEAIQSRMRTFWYNMLAKSPNPYSLACLASKSVPSQSTELDSFNIHIDFFNCQLSGDALSTLTNSGGASVYTLVVRVGGNAFRYVDARLDLKSRMLLFSNKDLIVPAVCNTTLYPIIYLYLLSPTSTGSSSESTTILRNRSVLAQCNLVVARAELVRGTPRIYNLPMRDFKNSKFGLISFNIHASDSHFESEDPASERDKIQLNSSKSGPQIKIEFVEGNIVDIALPGPSNTQPFFECISLNLSSSSSIYIPKGLSNDQPTSKARTGFTTVSEMNEQWNLSCNLQLPGNSMEQLGGTFATSKSPGLMYSIGIICRDASRNGCPELGWVRITIPSRLIANGQAYEQWVTLTPSAITPYNSTSNNPSTDRIPVRQAMSRFKLVIKQIVNDDSSYTTSTGIGAVLFRLLGIYESRTIDDGYDGVLTASASSFMLPPDGVANAFPEEDVDDEQNVLCKYSQLKCSSMLFPDDLNVLNDDGLYGSLHIPCGQSNVKVDVKTLHNVTYDTTFPTMATVTKATYGTTLTNNFLSTRNGTPSVNICPPIPTLELNLILKAVNQYGEAMSKSASTVNYSYQKRPPKLRMDAVFVPFVTGKLVMALENFQLVDKNLLNSADSKKATLRYALGTTSFHFSFSQPFEIQNKKESPENKSASAPLKLNKSKSGNSSIGTSPNRSKLIQKPNNSAKKLVKSGSTNDESNNNLLVNNFSQNVSTMDVETYDVITNNEDSKKSAKNENISNCGLIPLLVQFLVLDPNFDYSPHTCLGVGKVDTAALYYQALRAAASSPLNLGSNGTPNFGASPWLPTKVELYNPQTRRLTAIANINLQFIIKEIPAQILQSIDYAIGKYRANDFKTLSSLNPTENVKLELALKNSFLEADTDNSGFVSSEELLKVINTVKKNDASPSKADSSSDLIKDLVNSFNESSIYSGEAENSDQSNSFMQSMFNKLDVDGDGQISWWEWKSFLKAAAYSKLLRSLPRNQINFNSGKLSTRHQELDDKIDALLKMQGGFVDPMDSLVIGYQAASDALKTMKSISNADHTHHGVDQTQDAIPFIPLLNHLVASDFPQLDMSSNYQVVDDNGLILPPNIDSISGSSKAVLRLQNMIKSLRMTNNTISKRLEKALGTANNLSINLDDIDDLNKTLPLPPSGLSRIDAELIERRISESEMDAIINHKALIEIKDKANQLFLQVQEFQSLDEALKADHALRIESKKKLNDKLKQEISGHSNTLKTIKELRKLKMFSLWNIQRFFKKVVVPFLQNRTRMRAAQKLGHFVKSKQMKNNYEKNKKERKEASMVIQRTIRGKVHRNLLKRMNHGSSLIKQFYQQKKLMWAAKILLAKRKNAKKILTLLTKNYHYMMKICLDQLKVAVEEVKLAEIDAVIVKETYCKDRIIKKWIGLYNWSRLQKHDVAMRYSRRLLSQAVHNVKEKIIIEEEEIRTAAMISEFRKCKELELKNALSRHEEYRKHRKEQAPLLIIFSFANKHRKPKPAVEDVLNNYWIDLSSANIDEDVFHAHRTDPFSKLGKVVDIQIPSRLMTVKYLYRPKVLPNDPFLARKDLPMAELQFVERVIPFDHPGITWYHSMDNEPPAHGEHTKKIAGRIIKRALQKCTGHTHKKKFWGEYNEKVRKELKEKLAAKTIQGQIRMKLARVEVNNRRHARRRDIATRKIQRSMRMKKSRMIVAKKRLERDERFAKIKEEKRRNEEEKKKKKIEKLHLEEMIRSKLKEKIMMDHLNASEKQKYLEVQEHERFRNEQEKLFSIFRFFNRNEKPQPDLSKAIDYWIRADIKYEDELVDTVDKFDPFSTLGKVEEVDPESRVMVVKYLYRNKMKTSSSTKLLRHQIVHPNEQSIHNQVHDNEVQDVVFMKPFHNYHPHKLDYRFVVRMIPYDHPKINWFKIGEDQLETMKQGDEKKAEPIKNEKFLLVDSLNQMLSELEKHAEIYDEESRNDGEDTATSEQHLDEEPMTVKEGMDREDTATLNHLLDEESKKVRGESTVPDPSVEAGQEEERFRKLIKNPYMLHGKRNDELYRELVLFERLGYIESCPKPSLEESDQGYFVSHTGTEVDHHGMTRFGKVVAWKLTPSLILIDDISIPVSYEDVGLKWFKMPLEFEKEYMLSQRDRNTPYRMESETAVPNSVHEAVGYRVEIKTHKEFTHFHDVYTGSIIRSNPDNQTLCVAFDTHDQYADDLEIVTHELPDIAWIAEPTDLKTLRVKDVKETFIHAPKMITDTIGYKVKIQSRESNSKIRELFQGKIISYDEESYSVVVQYIHDLVPADGSNTNRSTEEMEINFRSPDIIWLIKDTTNHPVLKVIPNDDHQVMEDSKKDNPFSILPRPNSIKEVVGYKVEVQSHENGAKLGDMFEGIVTAFDEVKELVRIKFFAEDLAEDNFEDLAFKSTDIAWMEKPTDEANPLSSLPRPRTLKEAIGYKVEVQSHEEGAKMGEMYQGIVTAVDAVKEVIRVKFYANDLSEDNFEDIPFKSSDVAWIEMPSDEINPLSIIGRPKSIKDAIGCRVGIQNHDEGAKFGEMFEGTVTGLDVKRALIRVKFDVDEDSSLISGDAEDFPWKSPDIAWLKMPGKKNEEETVKLSTTLNAFSQVARPKKLIDAVGYGVEVQSREENAELGDMFDGVITRVNHYNRTVRVKFTSNDDSADDFEDLPFDSHHIAWMKVPTDQINPLSALPRPRSILDAMGYQVDVQSFEGGAQIGDMRKGLVIGVNEFKQTIRVKYEEVSDESEEEIPWKSPDVAWMKLPKAGNHKGFDNNKYSKVSRPKKITDANGYKVELQCRDNGAKEGDMYPGKVVSVNKVNGTILIQFDPPDDLTIDSTMEEDSAEVLWTSSDIGWIKAPHKDDHTSANVRDRVVKSSYSVVPISHNAKVKTVVENLPMEVKPNVLPLPIVIDEIKEAGKSVEVSKDPTPKYQDMVGWIITMSDTDFDNVDYDNSVDSITSDEERLGLVRRKATEYMKKTAEPTTPSSKKMLTDILLKGKVVGIQEMVPNGMLKVKFFDENGELSDEIEEIPSDMVGLKWVMKV